MSFVPNLFVGLQQPKKYQLTKRISDGAGKGPGRIDFRNHAGRTVFALLILLAILLAPIQVFADSVTLAWDPNDTTPDGYKVYMRPDSGSYNYNSPVCPKQGDDPRKTACLVENLTPDTLYHFVVQAHVDGEYSDNSTELRHRTAPHQTVHHAIQASSGPNGSITPSGTITVVDGSQKTFGFYPNPGYAIADVIVDGVSKGVRDSYTMTNIDTDCSINVTFGKINNTNTHTVTASAGTGGTITPSGTFTVDHGSQKTFDFYPNPGYVVADVIVNGVSKGTSDRYTMTNIDTDCTIAVSFAMGNQPPQAEAGPSQSVKADETVVLNGERSKDPEGGKLSFKWSQTNINKSTPTVKLTNASQAIATFTAPQVADKSVTLVFELKVNDPDGAQSTDTCLIQVIPSPKTDTDGDGTPDESDTDDDDDGMPDSWELEYGLNPLNNKDAGLDPDKDGQTNLEEYLAGTNPYEAPGNTAPSTPEIVKPANGAESVRLSPWLKGSKFLDSDDGDIHGQTQWRIVDSTTQEIVWDVTTSNKWSWRLTNIRTQRLTLDPSTTYLLSVRYYDHHGAPSEWSPTVSFTTEADSKDTNRNKIPDAAEPTSDCDLNFDAIADYKQIDMILALFTFDRGRLFAASVEHDPGDAEIVGVESFDPDVMEEPPHEQGDTPFGLLAYRVKVAEPGDSALVSIYLSDPVASPENTKWVTYDSAKGWQDRTDTVTVSEDGMMAQRLIQDGGPSDADGTANGTIVEMLGPMEAVPGDQTQSPGSGLSDSGGNASSSGSAGAGCFLDTLF